MKKLLSLAAATFLLSLPAFAAPGDPDPGKPPAARERTSALTRYDTNKDGVVDRTEWATAQETRFKLLDTNHDGKLSKDELFVGTGAPPSDRQIRSQATYFRLLDTDKDGTVSKAEFMAQAERNFARCDSDKDGRISTAECRQALRRKPVEPVSTGR
ncbi:MAG: EF-hand domain-containing protein [Proteobacteria bacterium]|nr:EF-hand domain-containing protein [Pseudomonadota bacterium]